MGGGLDYANGRYYDPTNGRFLTPDPLPAEPVHFAKSNPTSYNDPCGREDSLEEAQLDAQTASLAAEGEGRTWSTSPKRRCYVGITNSSQGPSAQHDGRFVITNYEVLSKDKPGSSNSPSSALGLGGKLGQTGKLLNKINSIAPGGALWNLGVSVSEPFVGLDAILSSFFGSCP